MDDIKISILVPVYNVEKYLPRCIESVLSQDFTDYELILVDDGSFDKSGEICDEYSLKYSKIKVLHQKNGGASLARLSAFNISTGKYVIFLDSDDYLLQNALTIFYNKIEEGNDVVRCFPLRCNEKGEKWLERYNVDVGSFSDKDFFASSLIKNDIAPYLHSAIYKKSLFSEYFFEVQVENNITIGEDWIINFMISSNVSKVAFIEQALYVYFVNSHSIMTQMVQSWEYQDRISKILEDVYRQRPTEQLISSRIYDFRNRIKYFFLPELKFNNSKYSDTVKIYKKYKKEIRDVTEKKYLMFITNRYLFFIYSRIFCFLYLAVRLKFKKRQIIK